MLWRHAGMRIWLRLAHVGALAATVALLVGCSGGGQAIAGKNAPASGAAPAASGDKVKVTFFIWAGSNQGVVPREVADAYMKSHPNVEIEYLESTNAATYPKMVAAKKTTPDQPLVQFGFFNAATVDQGVVDDMWEPIDLAHVPNAKNT